MKCGNVRRLKPYGIRQPSMFCCPTRAMIWPKLMSVPLEPDLRIWLMRLSIPGLIPRCTMLEPSDRALLSRPFTCISKT